MTFPSQDGLLPLSEHFRRAQIAAGSVRRLAVRQRTIMRQSVTSDVIIGLTDAFNGQRQIIMAARSAPGIRQWVRDQYGNQARDIVADLDAMVAALDDVIQHIFNTFPKSSNGFMERDTLNSDGSVTERVFQPNQVAQLRNLLGALVATID